MDGVIDTLAWEGYREGVDDVRYVTTLQNAVAKAAASADPAGREKAAASEAFLRRLKAGTEIETGDLDAIRRDIVEYLTR